ncbi:hypothetical protein ELH94_30070 (plasmid) [Rhizobium leguminosarum]|uniref:hypothetical protein n=1 Tax=Rhizobium leguminosarum TaxID=384 RepID=UPI001032788F|nr:hypothetical protein [Rhizobium leguminosarum]TAX87142.1 hypothetical protein ELH94_30070 [Rhizobium leguminosarum]
MTDQSTAERVALSKMEPLWIAQGYTVLREPQLNNLPGFLGNFRPDAIATGKVPGLIIEVINPLSPSTKTKVRQLQTLFAGREDWKLEIVYLGTEPDFIDGTASEEIAATLATVMLLATVDSRAALLLGWACLEAAARTLHPGAENSLPPRSLIDLLVSRGDLGQAAGDDLRKFATMRNRLVHGQLNLKPTRGEIDRLIEIVGSIALPI